MANGAVTGFIARHDTRIRSLCRIGFAISILVVLVLSLLPDDDLPKVELSDKIGHFIAYGEIAAIGLLAYATAPVLVVAGVVALGAGIEIAQLYVPGRSSDIVDFMVNCLGVLAGIALARGLSALWPRRGP
jgi:VanZ family protein